MKTPIQELISCFKEVASITTDKIRRDAYETVLKQLINVGLQKEKQFGLVCFNAGKSFILQDYLSYIGEKPNFDEFYKQYES